LAKQAKVGNCASGMIQAPVPVSARARRKFSIVVLLGRRAGVPIVPSATISDKRCRYTSGAAADRAVEIVVLDGHQPKSIRGMAQALRVA